MKRSMGILGRAVALSTLIVATGLSTVQATEKMAATNVALLAGPAGPRTFVRPEPITAFRAPTARFVVTYNGFTPAARAAFQRAVDIWAQKVASPVPITVQATFQPLATGVLGSASSSFVFRNFPGAPRADTWFVDAIANKRAGQQLNPAPDIVANFSSVFPNWHFGAGPAPAGTYDFTAVVLHELGHGLGFLGGGSVAGNRGTVRFIGFPYIYDRFTENGAGTSLLSGFADNSVPLGNQLRGNNLFFDSPRVRLANGSLRAKLYAPAVFNPGSSYSHLDEATYRRGNPNSLMTPFLGQGETIRNPGPITLAIFKTIGW